MNAISPFPSTGHPPSAGALQLAGKTGLAALLSPDAGVPLMVEIAAVLALRGPVRILDGGNCFDAYRAARLLRRQAERAGAPGLFGQAVERMWVSRAFTCYQMTVLARDALRESGTAPLPPTLVLNLLDTFYDQSAPLFERQRLLDECLERLKRLSESTAVLMSVRPPRPPQVDGAGLFQQVQQAADRVWLHEEVQAQPTQLPLL